MKKDTIIKKIIENKEQEFYFDIVYSYGSPLIYPYVQGYYLTCCECETKDGQTYKNEKTIVRELLFEIDKPSEECLSVAEKVADNYMDLLIVQIVNDKDKKEVNFELDDEMKKRILESLKGGIVFNNNMGNIGNIGRSNTYNDNNINKMDNDGRDDLSKCKYYTKPSGVTFDDIAGMIEVKREIQEAIDLYNNKEKYEAMGVSSKMNNILLSGKPGSGKSLMVKAMSTELNRPLFQSSGEFAEKYVGMAVKNVKELFEEARKHAPSIVFIDECEQVARKRTGDSNNSERESATAELLNQLDGFITTDDIIVVLATNLVDSLDEALLRRMSKKIHLDNPDFTTRRGILEINAKNKPMDESCDLDKIARNLSGFNGGTIANIMNTAGIIAVRKDLDKITQVELEEAYEREVCGLKSETKKLNEKEKYIVSTHELGHAIVSHFVKGEKIQKISIIPTTGSTLGYVLYANEEQDDVFLKTKEEMYGDIITSLAGRASEEVIFGRVTGGCSNDLEKATQMAESMVCRLGMFEEFGLMSINPNDIFMREIVLNKVKVILDECYTQAKQILIENNDLLNKLIVELINKEELRYDDFMEIFENVNGAII